MYFITCNGKYYLNSNTLNKRFIESNLILDSKEKIENTYAQLSLFNE